VNERRASFEPRLGPRTHPDHHLWKNGRRWWVAFTYHTADERKFRVRSSLGTCDVEEARRLRDELLEAFGAGTGRKLSLRFAALSSFELPLGSESRGGAA